MDYGIDIFKDKKGNILIIPLAFDENGIRRDTNKFKTVENADGYRIIGEKVIECFSEVVKEPFQKMELAVMAHELATGIKSYKAFSKDRLMVAGSYNRKTGYTFMPWKRYPDGSYGLDKGEEIIFKADIDASAEEIGEIVIKAFEATNQLK